MTERQPGLAGIVLLFTWILFLLCSVILRQQGHREWGNGVATGAGTVLAWGALRFLRKRRVEYSGWRSMMRADDIDIAMASAVSLLSMFLIAAPIIVTFTR